MDGWKMNFLLGWPNFRGKLLVSGRVENWGRKEYFPKEFSILTHHSGNWIRQKGMNHNSKPSRNGRPLDIQPEFHGLPWFDNKLQVRLPRKISEILVFQGNPGCWNIIIWKDIVLKSKRGYHKTIPMCQLFLSEAHTKSCKIKIFKRKSWVFLGEYLRYIATNKTTYICIYIYV